jgi:hypothetical protein
MIGVPFDVDNSLEDIEEGVAASSALEHYVRS